MQRPRRRGASKLSLIVLGVFVVLLGGASLAAFKTLTFVSNVSTANLGDNIKSIVAAAPIASILPSDSPSPNPSVAPPLPNRINVLLMGYGGVGHDGALLTDSIMVLSFDSQTKKAAMISVPRDIWIRIPYDDRGGFWKLNTAYAIGDDDASFPNKNAAYKGAAGGGNLASATVGSLLGIKIDYWVAVDFHAFKSMVDALGGVDLDVDTTFTDYEYPRNDDPTIDASYMTVHFNAGRQHMNGEQAIEFARSRHSLEDGTDFGRSKRQQKLLLAIKDKALTADGLTKAFGLMDALSKDFKTNMTIGQMRTLAEAAKGVDPASIDRISIDNSNYLLDGQTVDGQDVLVPQGKTWKPLRTYIAGVLMDPAIKTEAARIQLWNGSGQTGVATNATTMLSDLGFQTLPPQSLDAANVQQNEIHDLSQGKDVSTVKYLASLFSAKIVSDPSDSTLPADIKVVLGKAYAEPINIVDGYDTSVRPLFGGPGLIAPAPAPAASNVAKPAASGPAASSASASPAAASKPQGPTGTASAPARPYSGTSPSASQAASRPATTFPTSAKPAAQAAIHPAHRVSG